MISLMMTEQNGKLILSNDANDDKVEFKPNNHNGIINLNNHLENGLGSKSLKSIKSSKEMNDSNVLTAKQRKSINIDSICHLNWMLIILLFTLVNMYDFGYIETKCKESKKSQIIFSRIIISMTVVESTFFYLIWFLMTKSKYYHMQMIYDSITGLHIFISFINILFAVTTFLTRTCDENKLNVDLDLRNLNKLELIAIKYDLKVAGLFHILMTIIVAFSAIHLTTKRSRFFLRSLNRRGLLTEYFWEVND